MPEGAIEVHGLRDFRRELRRMGQEFPRELRQANKGAADLVAPEARRRVPRGPHQGGGRVQPIIASVKAGGTQRAGYVAIGGARSPHAPVYEFGGTLRRHASASRTQVTARPFLYPAIAARTDEVVDFYGRALDRLSRRAFDR
jgi:hypothetical protein